jgi:hypothetical protein
VSSAGKHMSVGAGTCARVSASLTLDFNMDLNETPQRFFIGCTQTVWLLNAWLTALYAA